MSLLKAIKAQLGLSATATQNFTLTAEAADGSMKLARGNAGATTQDILTVDSDGRVGHGVVMGCIRLNTANGYGSTNTVIRRFTNTVLSQGNDITYTDSATNGASFTINKSGVYAISYTDNFAGANYLGVSLNSAQLTTSVVTITASNRLTYSVTAANDFPNFCGWVGYLTAGDVLRPHTNGVTANGATGIAHFTITRVS